MARSGELWPDGVYFAQLIVLYLMFTFLCLLQNIYTSPLAIRAKFKVCILNSLGLGRACNEDKKSESENGQFIVRNVTV